jgi:hypothetical protein
MQLARCKDKPRKRIKFSRSTNGCFGCRQQKVKCDETLPTCLRCIASQRECRFPERTKTRSSSPTRIEPVLPEEGNKQSTGPSQTESTITPAVPVASDPFSTLEPFAVDLESLLASVTGPENVNGGNVGSDWFDWDMTMPIAPASQPVEAVSAQLDYSNPQG